ncbi:MAG TPA: VWA domain-containing protein, partial [Devosia sp.]|nr:VWA domain-containing protein [Devosia sp.]
PDQGAAVDATNCAVLSTDGEEIDRSCTDLTNEELDVIDVALEKAWTPDPVVVGFGTFALTVTNVGDAFDATDALSVTDNVPEGMTITSVVGTDWECSPLPAVGPETLTCQYTGTETIETGATLTLELKSAAEETGLFENCAAVSVAPGSGYEDGNSDNNSDCVEIVEEDDDFDEPDDEPEYDPVCGTNVIFVVDESRSIADANATSYVNNALASAAAIFNTNGAQAAVVRFSDNAVVSYPMASGTFPLVSNGYNPASGGGTNWEAGLLAANSLLPSPNTIIVFITDGTPTAYLDGGGAVAYATNSVLATNEAIGAVNMIYGQGTPIVGIGIGSVSTHLDALLGTGSMASSYAGLGADLTALARQACPDLYLTKTVNPGYVDFHYVTGDLIATVTLKVTNTSTATLTNVTVEDELPDDLTNPTGFSHPTTLTGSTVSWTIPSIASGATETLTFQTILVPNPPATESWRCFANYAQVTATDQTLNSVPANMADSLLGPVHEHDEASANICVRDKEPVPPPDCGSSYLWVTKKTDFPEVCVPGGSPACSFTITVRAQCKDFSGPVLFGDGVSNAGTGVTASISGITNTAVPSICAWPADWSSTSTPSECLANLVLPVNQSVTFSVTLDAPLPAGSGYRNCFVADGKTVVPSDYAAALLDVNPTTAPTGGAWGNCAPFSVAGPPLPIPRPPQPEDRRPITCNAPAQPSADGKVCVCPRGTVAQGNQCVTPDQPPNVPSEPDKPIICNPPAVPNQAGNACVCPRGTIPLGNRCIVPELPDVLLPKAEP